MKHIISLMVFIFIYGCFPGELRTKPDINNPPKIVYSNPNYGVIENSSVEEITVALTDYDEDTLTLSWFLYSIDQDRGIRIASEDIKAEVDRNVTTVFSIGEGTEAYNIIECNKWYIIELLVSDRGAYPDGEYPDSSKEDSAKVEVDTRIWLINKGCK